MNATSVEQIKTKVDKLITAYQAQQIEIKQLNADNSSLRRHIEDLKTQLNSSKASTAETTLLKKKVNLLIEEVDNCIELANS